MEAASAQQTEQGRDGERVNQYEALVLGVVALVSSGTRDGIVQRLHTLDDALSMALDKKVRAGSSQETSVLRNMRARINAALSPLEALKAELARLADALAPYKDLANTLDDHHVLLEQRAALLDRREADLAEQRRKLAHQEDTLQADKAAFGRALDASARDGAELDALRSRARQAEEAVYHKDTR